MSKEPTPEQKKMIERALKDTLETIGDAAETSFEKEGIKSIVPSAALMRWRLRYTPMFRHAIVDLRRDWDTDKDQVLERARQVGVVAANMASIKAIVFAWSRGEIGKPGQYVHVRNAPQPEITAGMAELAARCIDCLTRDDDQGGIRWDWCSTSQAPPLPDLDLRVLSTPPTIREIIEFLRDEAFQAEIENGRRLATGSGE